MKLYFDDLRPCPPGWTLARNMREAQLLVEHNLNSLEEMSLDHDMGIHYCRSCTFSDCGGEPCLNDSYEPVCGCTCHVMEPTGLDFLVWIRDAGHWPIAKPVVHSANPIGAKRMKDFIADFGPYSKD